MWGMGRNFEKKLREHELYLIPILLFFYLLLAVLFKDVSNMLNMMPSSVLQTPQIHGLLMMLLFGNRIKVCTSVFYQLIYSRHENQTIPSLFCVNKEADAMGILIRTKEVHLSCM